MSKLLAILIAITVCYAGWRAGVAFGLGQVDCHCPPSVVVEISSEEIAKQLMNSNEVFLKLEVRNDQEIN